MNRHDQPETIPEASTSRASTSTIPIHSPSNGAAPRLSLEAGDDSSNPSSSYPPRTATRKRADSSPRTSRTSSQSGRFDSHLPARSPRTPRTPGGSDTRPGHVSRRSIAHGPAILGFHVRSPVASNDGWGATPVGLGVLGSGVADEMARGPEDDVYWELDLNSPVKPRARPDGEDKGQGLPRSSFSLGGLAGTGTKSRGLWTQWGSLLGSGSTGAARSGTALEGSAPPDVQVFDAADLESGMSSSRNKGKGRSDDLDEEGSTSIAMERVGSSQHAASHANGRHHEEDSSTISDADADADADEPSLPSFGLGPHESQHDARTRPRPYGRHNRSLHDLTLGAGAENSAGADDSFREREEGEDAALLFDARGSSSDSAGEGEPGEKRPHRRSSAQGIANGYADRPSLEESYDAEAALGYGMADLAGSRSAKLDFEPLARKEKVAYWIVTCCVITLSLVAVSIGVDWIDWPGDGLGEN